MFRGFDDFYNKKWFKTKPICLSCKHQKYGMTTVCEKFRRISPDTQDGGPCSFYKRKEVD
jgi:hypothetical protein